MTDQSSSPRPTIAKLEKMVKDGFLNIDFYSFSTLNQKNNTITEDLLEIKDHIIKNLVESNKNLQKKVTQLENQLIIMKTFYGSTSMILNQTTNTIEETT